MTQLGRSRTDFPVVQGVERQGEPLVDSNGPLRWAFAGVEAHGFFLISIERTRALPIRVIPVDNWEHVTLTVPQKFPLPCGTSG